MIAAAPPAAGHRTPVPFVTVSFRRDLALLRLQARSFAIHLAQEPGRRIYVINNDNEGNAFAEAFRREVLGAYGPHAGQVTLLEREACLRGFDELKGWRRQQLLKWAVAPVLEHGVYLTLDSKNCLIRPWRDADLFTADGRLRLRRRRVDATLRPSVRYFLAPEAEPEWVCNIMTPFAMLARHVAGLIAAIERREGRSAYQVLAERPDLFEYELYYAYLVAIGAQDLYDLQQPPLQTGLWFKPDEDARAALDEACRQPVPWFAIHRRITHASPALRADVAAVLQARGLFDTVAEALASLGRPRSA